MRALSPSYSFKIFTRHELEANFFDDIDIVCIPGGLGDASSFDYLLGENGPRIQQFIQQGGKYLGICMGAYWAGKHYLNMLEDIDAVQYLTQPNTDTRRPHAKNIAITWDNIPMNMFWYDGCALVGNTSNLEIVATYANGDAMAIIKDRIGLIGCHPESEQFWYDSYSWMKGKYHNGSHHKILLEFVNKLMQK